jgi:diguanylate cyclase (GGDEF)-like protein/PAS domain S-box-containing protein
MTLRDSSAEPRHEASHTGAARARETAEPEELLKLIYNSTHDCIFLMRVDGPGLFRCESINLAYSTVTGLRAEQVIGYRPEDILPPDAAAFALGRYQAAIDAATSLTYFEDLVLPAGRVVFETILTPIINSTGECTHLLGALRDITARMLAEEALRGSEARYRQLFESNGSVQFLVDVGTGHIIDANPAAERFYGWTRDQMRAMVASDIADIGIDDWRVFAADESHDHATPTLRIHKLASGERRTVEIFAGKFLLGDRLVFHSIVHDVSDRIRAEEALRDSESRFRSALDNSLDIFTVLDTIRDADGTIIDFRVVEVNARAGTVFGLDASRMIGRSFSELLPYAANDALLQSLIGVAETGEATETEVQPRVGPLAGKWLSCQIVALGRGVAITARDVTDRRRAEDELRALSLIDSLTGLLNRRGFEAIATQQLKSAEYSTNPSFLFYFDMNDFKAINDTWGHAAGDEALVRMSAVLRETFREVDVIARMGGDEFVVLVLNCSEMPSMMLTRLREGLKQQNSRNTRSGTNYLLSTGVGIARFNPDSPRSLDMLLATADRELYEDKRLGERETA